MFSSSGWDESPVMEDPTIRAMVAESEAKGEIKGLREAILDAVSANFSSQVVTQVQQTIAPIQDPQLLRKFNRQLARVSDEQEVYTLLFQCFPTHWGWTTPDPSWINNSKFCV